MDKTQVGGPSPNIMNTDVHRCPNWMTSKVPPLVSGLIHVQTINKIIHTQTLGIFVILILLEQL